MCKVSLFSLALATLNRVKCKFMTTDTSSRVYTISELSTEVQSYLKQRYPTTIWVQGEVKNYNRNAHKNHIFFELCEKDPDSDKIRARITAVIFEGMKPRIAASLAKVKDGFQLQDDIEVKFECLVDLYPPSGSYQLKIVDIDPVYTLGKIAQQRYVILETLKREGLLDKNKMLPVALVPLKIGLITSYNSAAYHDFLKELAESHYAFQLFHVNAHMQGHLVEKEICDGIELLNQQEVEVIVIIRGGGSRSDMSWFDSLKIGKTVAYSQTPVFTGLGHEIDLSVTDLVAHTYQKTPTAIAQHLVELVGEFLIRLEQYGSRVFQRGEELIREGRGEIRDSTKRLEEMAENRIQQSGRILLDSAWSLRESHHRLIRDTLLRLQTGSARIKIRASLNIRTAREQIAIFQDRLPRIIEAQLKSKRHRLQLLEVQRNALDPMQVLQRGYTLSLNSQGETLRRLSQVKLGDSITTVLVEGDIKSWVTEKCPRQPGQIASPSTKSKKRPKPPQFPQPIERQMTLF